ncbi:MAG: hypothetical protein K2J84_07380, partial [Bacteroidaceae bacterium]|nr:hypothetical protein [Bacteroidaceae bacterium]
GENEQEEKKKGRKRGERDAGKEKWEKGRKSRASPTIHASTAVRTPFFLVRKEKHCNFASNYE